MNRWIHLFLDLTAAHKIVRFIDLACKYSIPSENILSKLMHFLPSSLPPKAIQVLEYKYNCWATTTEKECLNNNVTNCINFRNCPLFPFVKWIAINLYNKIITYGMKWTIWLAIKEFYVFMPTKSINNWDLFLTNNQIDWSDEEHSDNTYSTNLKLL